MRYVAPAILLAVCVGIAAWQAASVAAGEEGTPPPGSLPADLPEVRFHLTPRPWSPAARPRDADLDDLERAVRAMVPLQHWDDSNHSDPLNGAIIDPYDHKELQYATPLFAFNVATLLAVDRAAGLAPAAARALDRATLDVSDGPANDWHGEFFMAAMVKAIRLLEPLRDRHPAITADRLATWRQRMRADRKAFMNMKVKQNWRTFAMKGEWLRQQEGLIDDDVSWIEANWTKPGEGSQRERFRRDLDRYGMTPHFFLYHDDTASPETFTYNGAVNANLLDMLANGYDGPSAAEMREILSRNMQATLLLLGGCGEAPAGGRTGEHTWSDTIHATACELMARESARAGDQRKAGQFRHAAALLLRSHARFQQERGWFSVTKNQCHPFLKRHYASWSGVANYEGLTLTCGLEALASRDDAIGEQPAPCEIGGYAAVLDPSYAAVMLNAGGMQAQLCTRGETDAYGGVQWHVLGITRFSRAGWDSRLGPGAGHVDKDFGDGVSFSPAYHDGSGWRRVCLEPRRFHGSFAPGFVHPLLVRGTFTIGPGEGLDGPTFVMDITGTPDGMRITTTGTGRWGMVWPLLKFDGRTMLDCHVGRQIASTAYPPVAGGAVELDRVDAESADSGDGLRWTGRNISGPVAALGVRYAFAGGRDDERHATLVIAGLEPRSLTFPSTGGIDDWHELVVPVAHGAAMPLDVRLVLDDADGIVVGPLRAYPRNATRTPDRQNFIALRDTHRLDATAPVVRGGYGDLRPVLVTDSDDRPIDTFVYPSSDGDPDAASVRGSFRAEGADFSTVLGRVHGSLYVGRTAAGGVGRSIDVDGDGLDDLVFDRECSFIAQLDAGRIVRVEADRHLKATIGAATLTIDPYSPVEVR